MRINLLMLRNPPPQGLASFKPPGHKSRPSIEAGNLLWTAYSVQNGGNKKGPHWSLVDICFPIIIEYNPRVPHFVVCWLIRASESSFGGQRVVSAGFTPIAGSTPLSPDCGLLHPPTPSVVFLRVMDHNTQEGHTSITHKLRKYFNRIEQKHICINILSTCQHHLWFAPTLNLDLPQ